MIVHGYSMDAYCDGGSSWHMSNSATSIGGKNEVDCLKQLKAMGWKLEKERQLCPDCARKEKEKAAAAVHSFCPDNRD